MASTGTTEQDGFKSNLGVFVCAVCVCGFCAGFPPQSKDVQEVRATGDSKLTTCE